MPNYTIWTMHGEVGVNVLQENDDNVDMPDVAIHDADEEPDVNTEPCRCGTTGYPARKVEDLV